MWWFYGWSGFWNMINSACSCATFQDKRSWATHYPPQLNPTSLPFSSKKNPPDLAKKLPAKLPTSSLSQKKDTAAAAGNAKCQGDSEGLLFQILNLVHQNKALVTGLKDHISPNVQQQIWSVGWKEYIDNQSSQRKKLTRLKLGLFHSKAAKLPSSSRALFARSSRGRTPNATVTQWNPSCSSVNGQPVCSSYRNSAVAFPPQVPENTHFCFTQHEGKL